jgi:HD-like signal output (HDOD) protein
MKLDFVCQKCKKSYKNDDDVLDYGTRFRVCSKGELWFLCPCRNFLKLPKDKSDWYKPESFMSSEAKVIFLRIKKIASFPYIPNEILTVSNLISNEEVSFEALEKEIKKIPTLAYHVLKTANDLSSGEKIGKLLHAISYLGFHRLSEIILASALKTFSLKTAVYNHNIYWQASRISGIIGEFLTKKLKLPFEPDEVYLASSLCNIGKLIGAIVLSHETDHLYTLTLNPDKPMTWVEAEKQLGGIPHTILGEIASVVWGLPAYMNDSIKHHHTAPTPGEGPVGISHIAALSNQYSHWMMLEPHRIEPKIFSGYGKALDLPSSDLETLGSEIAQIFAKQKISSIV